jgi:hypothetical protein
MSEQDVRERLRHLAEQTADDGADYADLWDKGLSLRRRRTGSIALGGLAAGGLVLAGVLIGVDAGGTGPDRDSELRTADHGPLSDREYEVAVQAAQEQADKFADTVTSATASIGQGTEAGNLGADCTSGTLIHITIIGTFHGIDISPPPVGEGSPDPDLTPSALVITADPESGQACLLGVRSGEVTPRPDAVTLELE